MQRLAEGGNVIFDPLNRKLTLKQSGLEFTDRSYGAGEKHALNHVLRRHLDNDSSAGASHFVDSAELFDIVEDGWANKGQPYRQPNGNWVYDIDMSHRSSIGTLNERNLRIVVSDAGGVPAAPSKILVTTHPFL
jgi:hypothetical protein